jgi:GNAT superfamily N-acetyltransferase
MAEIGSEEFIYKSSKQNQKEDDNGIHTIDLVVNGKVVGGAELTYYSKPWPFYQINELWVEHEHQRKGYAGKIMIEVEEFLKKRKRAGVLVDGIMLGSYAKGMYERRGWQEVPGNARGILAFNIPRSANINALCGYSMRQTDPLERESWENVEAIPLEPDKNVEL